MTEWQPPSMAQRIGIYGGTFDPIHHGHLVAAIEVLSVMRLDTLVFMPAGVPPHKRHLAISKSQHRVQMVALAIAEQPQFTLSTLDLAPDRPAYTADLLAHLRDRWGAHHELFFIMGEDSLRDFPKWRTPDQIATLAQLIVVTRPNIEVDLATVTTTVPALAGRIHLVGIPQLDIASSDLRTRVATGQPIAFQVPTTVERYIREVGLYTTQPESPTQ